MNELNIAVAILTARVLAGSLFAFQGYDKLFNVGMVQLNATMKATLAPHRVPDGIIKLVSFTTSWIEFLCGILLFAGLFTPYTIWLLCADLILVSIGFSMAKPMWDTNHVFPRLLLLLFLLLAPETSYNISLDSLLNI